MYREYVRIEANTPAGSMIESNYSNLVREWECDIGKERTMSKSVHEKWRSIQMQVFSPMHGQVSISIDLCPIHAKEVLEPLRYAFSVRGMSISDFLSKD